MSNHRTKGERWSADMGGLLMFVLLSPILLLFLVFRSASALCLNLAVWLSWCTGGRFVVFVHSDSPVWQDHVNGVILPRPGERAIGLNWSERSRWKRSLPVLVFRHYAGHKEYNPMAIVFRPFHRTRCFRFFGPFNEHKQGKTDALLKLEAEFFALVDKICPAPGSPTATTNH
jgi:hypothetical protein